MQAASPAIATAPAKAQSRVKARADRNEAAVIGTDSFLRGGWRQTRTLAKAYAGRRKSAKRSLACHRSLRDGDADRQCPGYYPARPRRAAALRSDRSTRLN